MGWIGGFRFWRFVVASVLRRALSGRLLEKAKIAVKQLVRSGVGVRTTTHAQSAVEAFAA